MRRKVLWDSIKKLLEEIFKINIEPAIGEGGDFSEYAPVFREIRHSLDLIYRHRGLPPFPESTLANIRSELEHLKGMIDACVKYVRKETMSIADHNTSVRSRMNELDNAWGNILAHMMYFRCVDPFGEEALTALQASFQESSSKLLDEMSGKRDEIQSKLDHVNKVSADLINKAEQVAVADYVKHFNHARIGYLVIAIVCLLAAAFLGHTVFDYSQEFLVQRADAQNWQQFWEHYMPRIVPMIVLLSFLFFALKQFQSAMHNVSAYLHRKIIMQTFQAFRDSAGEPGIKDQILLHAVKNAMDQTRTGYLSGDVDQQNLAPINEIKKTVGGNG